MHSFKVLILSFVILSQLWFFEPTCAAKRPKCHMIEMEKCFDKLHQLKEATHDPSFLLTSMDGLNRICRVVKVDFVGCILAYIQKCGTPLHKEVSKVLSDAILEHMEEICSVNSPFREEIIQTSACVHDKVLSTKEFHKECNNPFFTTVAWGEMKAHSKKPERNPIDYIVDSGCCAYRRWEDCSSPKIENQCSTKAQNVLTTVVSKLLGGIPNFICYRELFDHNSKICNNFPELDQQIKQINITYHDEQKFSFFGLLKFFLVRDS